jgi:hypothetical protein
MVFSNPKCFFGGEGGGERERESKQLEEKHKLDTTETCIN